MFKFGMKQVVTTAALMFCVVLVSMPKTAQASSWGVGLGFSAPVYSSGSYCSTGHYETRAENILVCPERHERRWVEGSYGYPGYFTQVCIPARYETRYTQVWIPGTCYTPSCNSGYGNYYSGGYNNYYSGYNNYYRGNYYNGNRYNNGSFNFGLNFRGR